MNIHVPIVKSNWDTCLAYPSCLVMKHDDASYPPHPFLLSIFRKVKFALLEGRLKFK